MPVYCFKCRKCGASVERLRPMRDSGQLETCGCGYLMSRDLTAETLGSTDLPYATPVQSDAMGIHPSAIPTFRKAHPHIEVNREGQIVLRSHRERKRVMKELGYHDRAGYC